MEELSFTIVKDTPASYFIYTGTDLTTSALIFMVKRGAETEYGVAETVFVNGLVNGLDINVPADQANSGNFPCDYRIVNENNVVLAEGSIALFNGGGNVDPGFDESVVNVIGNTITAGTNVTLDYRPDDNKLIINSTGGTDGGGAVDSVNGQTGAVVLDHTSVGAAPSAHHHDDRYYTRAENDTRYYTRAQADSTFVRVGTSNIPSVAEITAGRDIAASDANKILRCRFSAPGTMRIRVNSVVPVPKDTTITIMAVAHAVTITVDNATTTFLYPPGDYVLDPYESLTLIKVDSANGWQIL